MHGSERSQVVERRARRGPGHHDQPVHPGLGIGRHLGGIRGSGGDVTAVFLAGAIPMPTLVAATVPLLLRSCAWIRPSSRDPVTPQLVADSVAAIDAHLARCIGFASFRPEDTECIEAFLRADSVVVTGSDATVSAVAKRCRPGVVPIPYGHRISIAIVGAEATRGDALGAAAEGLARDVAFWDQLGCLSPIGVWVVDPDSRSSRRFGEALAAALARSERKWPRGAVDVSAAAALRAERTTAAMRAGVDVLTGAADAWTVVCEDGPTPRPTPLHRFVRVHPCSGGTRGLAAALAPLRGQVTAVAGAGWGTERDAWLELCARLGASRICPPGRLQTPPLAWHHDNRGVLTPLIRWCDVELP